MRWSTTSSGGIRSNTASRELGKRGLYPGTNANVSFELKPTMWMLNLADGEHDLLAIAERSGSVHGGTR